MLKLNKNIMKPNNSLHMTLKFASLSALLISVDKIQIHNITGLQSNTPLYFPYVLSQGIVECIKAINPELQQRQKAIQYTKMISVGIGIITSVVVSVGYNGLDYIINFSLVLVKCSLTTTVIEKLNKLHIDGISIILLIDFITKIPSMIMGLSTKPLSISLLFIASLGVIAYGNYKLIQSTEDINMHYKNTKDKFSLNTRNTYTTSLILSQFVTSLVSQNPIIQGSLLFIVNPLVQWFMASSTDTNELNKHMQQSNIYLNGLKHGKDTEDCLKLMIRMNGIKLGLVGASTFILSTLLIKAFAISINPVMLAIMVNSFINVRFSAKSLVKSNLKGVRGFVIQKN